MGSKSALKAPPLLGRLRRRPAALRAAMGRACGAANGGCAAVFFSVIIPKKCRARHRFHIYTGGPKVRPWPHFLAWPQSCLSRAYDRDAWHYSFTWSSGVTASQATRMSNLDHDMLSIFLVAFRMSRKLALVSLNQHGPGTSRSACAALRTRIAARQERLGALLCASLLARTADAQRAPLAGLTCAATPAQHCACSAACTAAHTSLTRVLCPSFTSAQSELLYVELCLAAVPAFCSWFGILCMVARSFSSWVFGRHLAAVTHLCLQTRTSSSLHFGSLLLFNLRLT